MLEGLEGNTSEGTLSSVALEALDVRSSAEGKLVLVVGGDLGELGSDGRVVGGKTAEEVKRLSCLLGLILLDQETGRLGKHEHAGAEDD